MSVRSGRRVRAGAMIGICAASLLAAPAQAAPPPEYLKITKVSGAGSGCRQGTYEGAAQDRGKRFIMEFNDYVVRTPRESPADEVQRNCTIKLDIQTVPGWTYALVSVTYRGVALRERGAKASLTARYYFEGGTGNREQSYPDIAKVDDGVLNEFKVLQQSQETVYMPCDSKRSLVIPTRLDVEGQSNARAEVQLGGTDGMTTVVDFEPISCPQP
ncbi:hypothetical protein GCM10010124_11380 [Pilimelia terevasa]|uniref:DUF4360 domain-containing protein n=1 Tax=Pilimelia terevasa TaxID=53372 RepID=A0A8J3FFI7_9ACTN|nr:DUF4360 domain-containing protein [Pilimelia terevasa]GGK20488.1 hypothetical protein GCM10010124_11380 [Pilimelia terevasa]